MMERGNKRHFNKIRKDLAEIYFHSDFHSAIQFWSDFTQLYWRAVRVLTQGISYINIPSGNFISQIRKSRSKQLSVRLLVDYSRKETSLKFIEEQDCQFSVSYMLQAFIIHQSVAGVLIKYFG